jgi:hypothetical protein
MGPALMLKFNYYIVLKSVLGQVMKNPKNNRCLKTHSKLTLAELALLLLMAKYKMFQTELTFKINLVYVIRFTVKKYRMTVLLKKLKADLAK